MKSIKKIIVSIALISGLFSNAIKAESPSTLSNIASLISNVCTGVWDATCYIAPKVGWLAGKGLNWSTWSLKEITASKTRVACVAAVAATAYYGLCCTKILMNAPTFWETNSILNYGSEEGNCDPKIGFGIFANGNHGLYTVLNNAMYIEYFEYTSNYFLNELYTERLKQLADEKKVTKERLEMVINKLSNILLELSSQSTISDLCHKALDNGTPLYEYKFLPDEAYNRIDKTPWYKYIIYTPALHSVNNACHQLIKRLYKAKVWRAALS